MRREGQLRRGWRVRHAIAIQLAPWLDHPNLRYFRDTPHDAVPILVSRRLIEANGGEWSPPVRARFIDYENGMVDIAFQRAALNNEEIQ